MDSVRTAGSAFDAQPLSGVYNLSRFYQYRLRLQVAVQGFRPVAVGDDHIVAKPGAPCNTKGLRVRAVTRPASARLPAAGVYSGNESIPCRNDPRPRPSRNAEVYTAVWIVAEAPNICRRDDYGIACFHFHGKDPHIRCCPRDPEAGSCQLIWTTGVYAYILQGERISLRDV
jgi:hypothetical protein